MRYLPIGELADQAHVRASAECGCMKFDQCVLLDTTDAAPGSSESAPL
ncbi:hypothetical protein [Streptomyces sp. NPDC056169]